MNLQDIIDQAGTLKPTATVIRDKKGKIVVEREELLSPNEKAQVVEASIQAGKLRFQARTKTTPVKPEFPIVKGYIYEYVVDGDCGSWKRCQHDQGSTVQNTGGGTNISINTTANIAASKTSPPATLAATALPLPLPLPTTTSMSGPIRMATYNVWFSQYQWEARLDALVDSLLAETEGSNDCNDGHIDNSSNSKNNDNIKTNSNDGRVQVLCLQEVTPRFLTKLMEYDFVRNQYYVAHGAQRTYGVCMLLDKHLVKTLDVTPVVSEVILPTKMGRSGLIVSFEKSRESVISTSSSCRSKTVPSITETPCPSTIFAICTIHLESSNSKDTRRQQLQIINDALKVYGTAILCGDFNISATGPYANQEEHDSIAGDKKQSLSLLPGYDDLWIRQATAAASAAANATDTGANNFTTEVRDQVELDGATYDSKQNRMLRQFTKFEDNARYDRVLVKEENNNRYCWKAQNIRIIGKKPIMNTDSTPTNNNSYMADALYISDHFGLMWEIIPYS